MSESSRAVPPLQRIEVALKRAPQIARPWIDGRLSFDEWDALWSDLDEAVALIPVVRALLVDADSMLSAYGYGRVVTKDEAKALSGRIRQAYESRS